MHPMTAKARSRLATAHRTKQPPEVIADRRSDLLEANVASAIDRMLADAPPLTDAQIDRLADRLRGVPTDDAVA